MLSKLNFIKLRNYFLVRIRGLACYTLYIYRFYPGLKLAKLINKKQIIDIKIDKINFKMAIDLQDEGIAIELFIGKLREYPNVLYFKKFLKEYKNQIDTVVEIGANIGYYAIYEDAIFKQLKKKVHIYAIEPVSRNQSVLRENAKLNNVSDITPIHAAIGEKDKKINILVPVQGNYTQIEGISGNELYSSDSVIKERIDMYSLRTLFSKYKIPRKNLLLRWDIEGYEYNLVKGNYDMFKELKNVHIIMEFHAFFLKEKKSIEFLNLLKELGFKLKYTVSCYPPYFIRMPKIVRWALIKMWLMEYNGTNLGLLPEFKTLDDLIKEFGNKESALYKYANLHFYLIKDN